MQSEVSVQIIVVDDGSTDGSDRVAIECACTDPRISIIRQPHLGASRARNAGTSNAHGRYIQYLDADDILEPDTLRMRVSALEQSGADVAYSDWSVWSCDGDGSFRISGVSRNQMGQRPDIQLLAQAFWPPGALLYRREFVERLGLWDEALFIAHDVDFLVRSALMGAQFVHVSVPGLKYRVDWTSSLSRSDPCRFVGEYYRIAVSVQTAWEAAGKLDSRQREALVGVLWHVCRASPDSAVVIEARGRIESLMAAGAYGS